MWLLKCRAQLKPFFLTKFSFLLYIYIFLSGLTLFFKVYIDGRFCLYWI